MLLIIVNSPIQNIHYRNNNVNKNIIENVAIKNCTLISNYVFTATDINNLVHSSYHL